MPTTENTKDQIDNKDIIPHFMGIAKIEIEWCCREVGVELNQRALDILTRSLYGWIETAARHNKNEEFYRDLLDECAKHLGKEVYVADDGSVMEDPIRLKIPELVARLAQNTDVAK